MPLDYTVDSLDAVPEALHEHYTESNGKYVLAVNGVKPISDVEKLQKSLEAERNNSKKYKSEYSAWESKFVGKTPDQVFADLEKIPLLEAESQGKVDPKKHQELLEITVKQRMAPLEHDLTKKAQAIAERDQIIEQYKAADRRRTIHDAVRTLAAKEGFQEQSYAGPEGALMLLAERYLTINSIGEVVVADEAKPYTAGLGLKEALGELKQHHPYLLKPSVGGGASGSSGGAAGSGSNPFKGNNLTERGKFMNENPTTWQAAMKAAGLSDPGQLHKGK